MDRKSNNQGIMPRRGSSHERLITYLYICLIAAVVAIGTWPKVAAADLVARWQLDEGSGTTASDSSGSNHGTLKNGLDAGWTANGKVGGALDFDGIDDCIDVGNPSDLQITGAMTITAWVKIDSFSSNGRIISKQGGSTKRGWSLNIESSGVGAFQIAESPSSVVIVNTADTLPTGQWIFLAGVYEPGSSLKIYLNGAIGLTTVTSGVPSSQYDSSLNVVIGRRPDNICPFDGMIDDVRIYNSVLTEGEIASIANGDANNTDALVVLENGNVGIGTDNPQEKLHVNGAVRADAFPLNSDLRWKDNIEPLNNALDLVTQLRGVSYDWIDSSRGEGRQIGVIAQEVEEIIPEVVHTDSQGYKSVEYSKLVAPIIESVKTLKAENESLKAALEEVYVRLEQLEKK